MLNRSSLKGFRFGRMASRSQVSDFESRLAALRWRRFTETVSCHLRFRAARFGLAPLRVSPGLGPNNFINSPKTGVRGSEAVRSNRCLCKSKTAAVLGSWSFARCRRTSCMGRGLFRTQDFHGAFRFSGFDGLRFTLHSRLSERVLRVCT